MSFVGGNKKKRNKKGGGGGGGGDGGRGAVHPFFIELYFLRWSKKESMVGEEREEKRRVEGRGALHPSLILQD